MMMVLEEENDGVELDVSVGVGVDGNMGRRVLVLVPLPVPVEEMMVSLLLRPIPSLGMLAEMMGKSTKIGL